MKTINGFISSIRRCLVLLYEFNHTVNLALKFLLIIPLTYVFLQAIDQVIPIIEILKFDSKSFDKIITTHIFIACFAFCAVTAVFNGMFTIALQGRFLLRTFVIANIKLIVFVSMIQLIKVPYVAEYINNPSNNGFLVAALIGIIYISAPIKSLLEQYSTNTYNNLSMSKSFNRESSRTVAIHEAGHFIAYFYYKNSIVNSIRLVSMEDFGRMFNTEIKDMPLEQKVVVLLAGRAAEDLHCKFAMLSSSDFTESSDYAKAVEIIKQNSLNYEQCTVELNRLYHEALRILLEHNDMLLRVSEEVERSRVLFKDDLLACVEGA